MLDAQDLLILVPARGGSKGLPGKNLAEIGGRSLLRWTADAVAAAGLDGATFILSTDDEEIADSGRAAGIDVPFLRPVELASDTASSADVADHALHWAEEARGFRPRALMLLQPTSPFRPPRALEEAMKRFDPPTVEGVVGVSRVHRTPATLFYGDDEGMLTTMGDPSLRETRRQDAHPMFTPNGALYLVDVDAYRRQRSFFLERTRGIEMGFIESLDLDDAEDLAVMRAIASAGLV